MADCFLLSSKSVSSDKDEDDLYRLFLRLSPQMNKKEIGQMSVQFEELSKGCHERNPERF